MTAAEYAELMAGRSDHYTLRPTGDVKGWRQYRLAYRVAGKRRSLYHWAPGYASAYCDAGGLLACIRTFEDPGAELLSTGEIT